MQTNLTTVQLKDAIVAEMKSEIESDIETGVIAGPVNSFSDLHDFVDANEYGGFCDDAKNQRLFEHFGVKNDEEYPQPYIEFINDCQNAIDAWIKDGAIQNMKPGIHCP